jgi:TonB family protein
MKPQIDSPATAAQGRLSPGTAAQGRLAGSDSGLVHELFERARGRRGVALTALFLALAGHAVAGTFTPNAHEQQRLAPPVELEFLPPEAPAPVPPPLPARVDQDDKPARARSERAPEPARAARLLTAKPDALPAQANEPVDFVSDPSATVYGGGVVAVGGTAAFGKAGARAGVAARGDIDAGPKRAAGDGLVAAGDLSRAPRLPESDPCRGFFPRNADSDSAQASVLLVIAKSGAVSSARVVAESPPSQGFGAAARACMLSKRFVPALDRAGEAAATSLRVNVRFNR